jgi:hypothetical protein
MRGKGQDSMLTYTRLKWGMVVVVAAVAGGTLIGFAQREASAGQKFTSPVFIDTSQRYARGSLGSARNSSSGLEYIGCSVWTTPTFGGEVTCSARMSGSSPPQASCTSWDDTFVDAARALNGDSYLSFVWDSQGDCIELTVGEYSQDPPKAL